MTPSRNPLATAVTLAMMAVGAQGAAAADQPSTAITIYSSAAPGGISPEFYRPIPGQGVPNAMAVPGYALVRDEREMKIRQGRSQLSFTDVAALIDPTTVTFTSLSDPATRVLEQNFQFDLVSTQKLLLKFIDREITVDKNAGNTVTPNSSRFIIVRDPFRAVRRGRQLFQRKFTRDQGHGPITGDGDGKTSIETDIIIGAGLADSCAACHGRPKGSAGAGGDVVTRPDSRDAPHLFGLGLKEMLADEITAELRNIRAQAISDARRFGASVTRSLRTSPGKGSINFGSITARPDGSVDTSRVNGVNKDLRVRPFFLHGETISMREFLVGAFNAEMGLEAVDQELRAAAAGGRFVTPSGMVLDGDLDTLETPPVTSASHDSDNDGVVNEIPTSLVDFMEFYLLHYFKPGLGENSPEPIPSGSGFPAPTSGEAADGLNQFRAIG